MQSLSIQNTFFSLNKEISLSAETKPVPNIRNIKDNCKIVLGNHDIHLLAVVEGKRKLSESDTFIDVLESSKLSTLKIG